MHLRMVKPKYALIGRVEGHEGWTVLSRFPDMESCEKAKRELREIESACVPITDPRVTIYYELVNRERRKRRLRPIFPDELIPWSFPYNLISLLGGE
jgi:hypothetical protein